MRIVAELRAVDLSSGHQFEEEIGAASSENEILIAKMEFSLRTGINSGAMFADARQTDFCVYLSAILLGGLLFNALLGWWWADPIAAIVMVPIIGKEGVEALQGKTCCDGADCH